MAQHIKIFNGSYRNQDVVDHVFPLIAHYKEGANGGFVTVDGSSLFGPDKNKIRIKVANTKSYEFIDGANESEIPCHVVAAPAVTETDEEAMARIANRFEILKDMTTAAIAGDVRAMIVTGPPGVGKSFGVETEIEKSATFDTISGRSEKCTIIKGAASAIGLYCLLYKYRSEGSVIAFDDCDTILWDEVSLNLLKGALDSGKKRRISWISDSRMLRQEDVPSSFDFKGSIIFITNLKFDQIRSKKLADHLAALQSRCHYLDLTIDTTRDKLLRIRQIATGGELFSDYDFTEEQVEEVLQFIEKNQKRMREISLRQALKIADLVKSFPHRWVELAETTCMRVA